MYTSTPCLSLLQPAKPACARSLCRSSVLRRLIIMSSEDRPKKEGVKSAQIDGQVILKIIKHCNDASPQLVTGQLLGLDVGHTLEITDCFPFPAGTADDDEDPGPNYQETMLRCLRDVNVDNNMVGWYQTAAMGAYQTVELIETFVRYQQNIKKCVCLIYDPQRSSRGELALKAVRVKDSFVELFTEHKISGNDLLNAKISWKDVFVDVPLKIHNSNLVQAMVTDLQPAVGANAGDADRLNLSFAPFMEKNIQGLIECIDDIVSEQQKVTQYHKAVARQQQQQAQWLQKRRAENLQRRAEGLEPLPEEDPVLFKPVAEPSGLDYFLVTNQLATYADQLNISAAQTMEKLYVLESLQKASL